MSKLYFGTFGEAKTGGRRILLFNGSKLI